MRGFWFKGKGWLSMEEKKKREKDCLDIAIKKIDQLHRCKIKYETEAPDFILVDGESIIGIEHFLVDTLLCKQTTKQGGHMLGSVSRKSEKQAHDIYGRYCYGRINKNEEKPVTEICELINCTLSHMNEFKCDEYEDNFLKIFKKHLQKIPNYKMKHNELEQFGFLCEIQIGANKLVWKVFSNHRWHKQRISGIPMTKRVWDEIKRAFNTSDLDFICFVVYFLNDKEHASAVYYDKNSNPKLYESFKYTITGYDTNIELQLAERN